MAYLRIFNGETLLEQRQLSAGQTTIGRTPDNDIVLNERAVSKRHAVIRKEGASYLLIDHDSANGVFVNGKRVQHHTLSYWDEIQILGFVIKFMAVPRLKGEEVGAARGSVLPAQDATMEIDVSSLGDLAKLRKTVKVPSLVLVDNTGRSLSRRLDKVNFTIGRSSACDLVTSGWLAPRVAASIQRRNDGCYLLPGSRGRVCVNGHRVSRPVILHDDDELRVRNLVMRFFHRPMERG